MGGTTVCETQLQLKLGSLRHHFPLLPESFFNPRLEL